MRQLPNQQSLKRCHVLQCRHVLGRGNRHAIIANIYSLDDYEAYISLSEQDSASDVNKEPNIFPWVGARGTTDTTFLDQYYITLRNMQNLNKQNNNYMDYADDSQASWNCANIHSIRSRNLFPRSGGLDGWV